MARDWDNEIMTMLLLTRRLDELAPNNAAPIPISMNQEYDDLGRLTWVLDIHVHIRGVTEYDITVADPSYTECLRRGYLGLGNEWNLRHTAARANAQFAVAV